MIFNKVVFQLFGDGYMNIQQTRIILAPLRQPKHDRLARRKTENNLNVQD
jgi:hypothetical protein